MKTRILKIAVLSVGLLAPLSLLTTNASASRCYSSWGVSFSSYGYKGKHHYRSHSYHYPRYRSYRHYPTYRYSRPRYYSRPSVSISIGSGHYGGFYRSLPYGYRSCVVGGLTYYTHGGRYFRPYNTGYVVVSDPYVVRPRTTTVSTRVVSSKYDAYPRIWVSGKEYLIDEGELFCITSSGLVWAELPYGSVASSLPTLATSVWYKDVEYFEAGGLHFQRVPEGYRLIVPPWEQEF